MSSAARPSRRYLALDIGRRRVGVAISDELGLIASPLRSVDMRREGLPALAGLIEQYRPERVVIGLPVTMAGAEGMQAAEVRAFAEQLEAAIDVPIVFWDERLTSFMAEQTLAESGRRGRRHRDKVDALAAAYILQSYLESQGH